MLTYLEFAGCDWKVFFHYRNLLFIHSFLILFTTFVLLEDILRNHIIVYDYIRGTHFTLNSITGENLLSLLHTSIFKHDPHVGICK